MSKTIWIGVAGGSCSGKTTFVNALEQQLSDLSVRAFHMDKYFYPPEQRPRIRGFVNGVEYRDDNHPDTMDLAKLHADLEQAAAETPDVILVEGILALWDEAIYSRLDLRLYADCPDEERTVRRIKRHLSWGQEFEEITDRYLNAVRPRFSQYVEPCKWRADLILNGSFPSDTALQMVCGWIRSRCSEN